MRLPTRLALIAVALLAVILLPQADQAPRPARAAFPGDNGKIAFETASHEIATAYPDGSGLDVLGAGSAPSWSPDGREIAYSSGGGISVMDEQGTFVRSVTSLPDASLPEWSPDGKKISFARSASGQAGIWVTAADGSGSPQRLTDVGVQHRWSPDGSTILFADGDVKIIPSSGGSPINLTNTPANLFERMVDWSPDGQSIVYSVLDLSQTNNNIFVMSASGGPGQQLTSTPAPGSVYPAWSPDGAKIAYNDVHPAGEPFSVLRIINAPGGASNGGGTALNISGAFPDWQPLPAIKVEFTQGIQELQSVSGLQGSLSGTGGVQPQAAPTAFPGEVGLIAFSREPVSGPDEDNVDIYTVQGSGGSALPLITGSTIDAHPAWSANGKRIAFTRDETRLMVASENGSGQMQVTSGSSPIGPPSWSRDGSRLVYAMEPGLFIAEVGTGTVQQLGPDCTCGPHVRWSPDGELIAFEDLAGGANIYTMRPDGTGKTLVVPNSRNPEWSPDGERLAYMRESQSTFGFDLLETPALGGPERTLVSGVGLTGISWSPGGEEIVYGASTGIHAVNVATLQVRQVVLTPPDHTDTDPSWQPLPALSVEFTQATQQLQSIGALLNDVQGDGKPPVPIVADKAAVMRLYFDDVDQTTEYLVDVTGQMTHSDHVTVDPGCTANDRRRNESGCDSVDYYFTPPQGNWAVHLKVSDTTDGSVLVDETFNLTSVDTSGLIVKYLPLCVKLTAGAAPTCPGNAVATTAPDLMKKLFPAADDELFYDALAVPNIVYDAPISDDEAVVADLRQRYDLMSQGGFVADQLAGWFAPGGVGTGTLGYSDPVWGGSTGQVTWQVDTTATDALDPQFTLAHEIGHNLGLRHVNLADGCGAQDNTTDWPYGDSTIQEVGFDVAAQQVIAPTKKDVMTYCSPPGSDIWISPHSYKKLLEGDFEPQSIRVAPQGGGPTEFIVVRGRAQADGSSGSLDSAYAISSGVPVEPSDPLGSHCLHFSGGSESDYCFKLEFESHRTHEPLESEPFVLRVPLPPGTTRLALMHGADELDALEASASAPTLAITDPPTGGEWSGQETITWSASDGDGGLLQYAVMYSADAGDTWLPLEVDSTDTELSLDTSVLAGDEVLIRVLASDGLNTTVETTGPVALSRGLSGDVDCSGAVNSIDALKLSRHVAGLPVAQTEPCPDVGTGDGDVFGDVNCDGNITAVDTLFVLRFVAALPVNVPNGCRQVGT